MSGAVLHEVKPGRDLQTNVEFYTALVLQSLGRWSRRHSSDLKGPPVYGSANANNALPAAIATYCLPSTP